MRDNSSVRRADRLFQIVQRLRRGKVVTAARLADELEVSLRTVYRDVADLIVLNHVEHPFVERRVVPLVPDLKDAGLLECGVRDEAKNILFGQTSESIREARKEK